MGAHTANLAVFSLVDDDLQQGLSTALFQQRHLCGDDRFPLQVLHGGEAGGGVMEFTRHRHLIDLVHLMLRVHEGIGKVAVVGKQQQPLAVQIQPSHRVYPLSAVGHQLGGVFAAHTVLPVIGIPVASEPFNGLDSLLSFVQMPPGIPVATVTAGKAGGKNAALYAISILAVEDAGLREQLKAFRREQAEQVLKADAELQAELKG